MELAVRLYTVAHNKWCAIGMNAAEGVAGYGSTKADALRDLADRFDGQVTYPGRTVEHSPGTDQQTPLESGKGVQPANLRQVGGRHYKTSIEHWDYVLANDIPYMEAQIIKYLTRWRKKNGLVDVHKAQHFLEKLLEYEEAKKSHADEDAANKVGG